MIQQSGQRFVIILWPWSKRTKICRNESIGTMSSYGDLRTRRAEIKIKRDIPKVNVFWTVSKRHVFTHFFAYIINGNLYLDMENWLTPQLRRGTGVHFPTRGDPPHRHNDVRGYLNRHLSGRWIDRATAADTTFCIWPPRSPDLTVRDFLLWVHISDSVYIPPLSATKPELTRRITAVIESVTQDMLDRAWHEWDLRLDVCRITHGAHIECI